MYDGNHSYNPTSHTIPCEYFINIKNAEEIHDQEKYNVIVNPPRILINEKALLFSNGRCIKPINNGTPSIWIRNLGIPYLKNKNGISRIKMKYENKIQMGS